MSLYRIGANTFDTTPSTGGDQEEPQVAPTPAASPERSRDGFAAISEWVPGEKSRPTPA